VVTKSGKIGMVSRIVTRDGDLAEAHGGEAVTITLDQAIDISRGDVLAAVDAWPMVADQFAAKILWMTGTWSSAHRECCPKC